MRVSTRWFPAFVSPIAIGLMLPTARAAAQQAERFQVSGDRVAVYNLAGVVTLEAGTGSAVVVELKRGGKDAARLKVEQGPIGDAATLRVVYPDDEVIYDPPGSTWHGSSSTRVRDDGTFGDTGHGDHEVRIRSSGSGMEAWGDLRILVPRGRRLDVHLVLGTMSATNVNGMLYLDGGATDVTTTSTAGGLSIDVGSGDVRVTSATGDVTVDTGSGDVWIDGVADGDVSVDTGSGNVSLGKVGAGTVRLDTGSGDVDGVQVTADDLTIDTGSGDITLSFDGAPKSLAVDAGSGSVTLTFPTGYSATVDLETSSGDLSVDFPLRINRREQDRLTGVIGSGAGRLRVETGSGDIEIKQH